MTTLLEGVIVVVLVLLAGIFAGLTLAFFRLDLTTLERKVKLGNHQAKKVYALRKKGNLLLCTLLLANVASYTSMAIFLGSLIHGVLAGLIATALIFIFGEILPQAIFPRYALWVGSKLAWLVRGMTILFYPISAPIAWLLDKLLGEEPPIVWSKDEIKEIIRFHEDIDGDIIDQDEERIVLGALTYSDKIAYDVMIPLSNVYCLEIDRKIDARLLSEIKSKGFSRIPVYKKEQTNVVGILYTLRLLGSSSIIGKKVGDFYTHRNLVRITGTKKLDELLNQLVYLKKQMALVIGKDQTFKGIVTVEDIVEEILRLKIEKM